ncbi:inositol monophosphatase family protein [Actinopolymorpha pittospori]
MLAISASIDADVVSALGLDGPDAEPIAGGRVSKVWRAYRDGAPVALRQSPPFRRLPEVAYECDLLVTLAKVGAPVAAILAGPTLVDGSIWVAFSWVDGAHPAVPVHNPASYGRLLAELHEHTTAPAAQLGQRPGWGRLDEFLTLPRPGGGTMAEVLPDFAQAFGTAGAWLRQMAEDVHGRLTAASIESFPQVVAHGDFAPGQVLMRANSVGAVLDWDFAHQDLRLADVAIAASMARPTVARAAEFVRGYFDVAGTDIGDLDLLADLRRAFHLTNLGNYLCARWAHGADITPQVKMLTERLEREQWWGPTLVAAAHEAAGTRSTHANPPSSPPVTRASSDLEVAHALADRAAVVAQHYFERGVTTQTKADASPVTEADRAVEQLLRDALAELRPDDGVLGEEFGGDATADRIWILDPIDGTGAFARGEPHWRIQIALDSGGEIVVAVVDAPALDVRWWAATGAGAHERVAGGPDQPLHVSQTARIDDALVAAHPWPVGRRLPAGTRQPAPTPLPLVELIRGELDAYLVQCCHTWDHAPWILLVQEAGGSFTDHSGGTAPDQRGGLYSNGRIHHELLGALTPPLTPRETVQ